MKRSKPLLVSAFLLVLVGEFALGLRLRRELAAIEATTLSSEERTRFNKELNSIADREKAAEAQLARAKAVNQPSRAQKRAPDTAKANGPTPTERMNAALQNPAFRKLLTEQQRALLDLKYARFFKNLRLAPDQLEKFKDLLVEKQLAKTDAVNIAGAAGVNVPTLSSNYLQVVTDAQQEVNGKIQTLLGPDAYGIYQHFEETYGTRLAVQNIQSTLSASGAQLTADQTDQLVEAWYRAQPLALQGNTTGSGINLSAGLSPADATAPVPASAEALAQPILTASQFQAVQLALSLQQAEMRMRELAIASRTGP